MFACFTTTGSPQDGKESKRLSYEKGRGMAGEHNYNHLTARADRFPVSLVFLANQLVNSIDC